MPSTCTRNAALNRYEKYVCLNGNVQMTYDCRDSKCNDLFCKTETISNNFCNTNSVPYKFTCDAVDFTPSLVYEDCSSGNGTEFKSSLGCVFNKNFQCENNKVTVKSWNFVIGCPSQLGPDTTKTVSIGECGWIGGTEYIRPKSCSSQSSRSSLFGFNFKYKIPFSMMFIILSTGFFVIAV
jgi:hypothetical protein